MSAEPDVTRCQQCGGYPIHHRDGKCIYPRQSGGPATIITGLSVDLGTVSREYFVWAGADKRKILAVIDRMHADLARLRGLLAVAAPPVITETRLEEDR